MLIEIYHPSSVVCLLVGSIWFSTIRQSLQVLNVRFTLRHGNQSPVYSINITHRNSVGKFNVQKTKNISGNISEFQEYICKNM